MPKNEMLLHAQDERRDAALRSITIKVKRGVFAEEIDLSNRTESERATAAQKNDAYSTSVLQSRAIPLALEKLKTLSTGTLEYIDTHVTDPSLKHDRLHAMFPSFRDWERETGSHSDIMFRDLIHLRREQVTASSMVAHSLFETYARSGIAKGTLHMLVDAEQAAQALALFRVAKKSRRIELGNRDNMPSKMLSPRDYLQARREETKRIASRLHMSPAVADYLRDHPQHLDSLIEYMERRSEPVHMTDLGLFAEHLKTAPAVSGGVL